MPWPDDIVTLLENAGVGLYDQDIFFSTMVSVPRLDSGAVITIVETGGTNPEYKQNSIKPSYLNPGAQLVARGVDYPTARAKAALAMDAAAVWNTTINGKFYQYIRPTTEIQDMKPDERGNARAGFNILGKKKP